MTLKKGPTKKKSFQFSVRNYFFKFHYKLREMSNVNSVIFISLKIFLVRKLLVYLILLPIVGLFIIRFNEYGIQGVKKKSDRPTHTGETGSGKGKQKYF